MPGLLNRKEKCLELISKVSEAATGKKSDFILSGTMQNIEDGDKKKTTVPK